MIFLYRTGIFTIKIWVEDYGGHENNFSIEELDQDWVNPSGEGVEPISVYLEDPEYQAEMIQETRVAHTGDIYLHLS